MNRDDRLEVISVAPSTKSDVYGVRLLWRRARHSTAVCDALYNAATGLSEIVAVEAGVGTEPTLAGDVSALLAPLMAPGQEPRPFAFLKLDIVGHSGISAKYPQRETDAVWDAVAAFVRDAITEHDGAPWTWQGDGGLCAFSGREKENQAVRCALAVFDRLSDFNQDRQHGNILPDDVQVTMRAAVHSGLAQDRLNKGEIHSRDINFVAHLEAQYTCPSAVSLSAEAFVDLDRELQGPFNKLPQGFEGHEVYTTAPATEVRAYVRSRHAHTEELERGLAEARLEIEQLSRQLDTGYQGSMLRALIAELSENYRSMGDQEHISTPLNVDTWNQYKGELDFLRAELRANVEAVYVEFQHVNQQCRERAALGAARLRASAAKPIAKQKEHLLPQVKELMTELASRIPG